MRKLITEDRNAYIDDMLKRIAETLQLNSTRRKLVEERYASVSNYIENSEGIFKNANIYSQGSYRLGTTVKPREGEEYDLDFVVQIDKDWQNMSFQLVYEEFKRLMEANGNWEKLVKGKNRCIRLDYADEFHMDIIPTCTKNIYKERNQIMVPDKREHKWVISNPEGYAQWFEEKYIAQKDIYLSNFYSGAEIRAAKDLPKDDPNYLKQPLQHAVQLIKRYRDIYFEKKMEFAPSSIVLTTLVAYMYQGEHSIYEAINMVVSRFDEAVSKELRHSRQFHISNPVLPEEVFTKEWDDKPELFKHFIDFLRSLKEVWINLDKLQGNELHSLFKKVFGEGVYEKSLASQGKFLESLRDKGLTGISKDDGKAGLFLGGNMMKDRTNTFHADE